MNPYKMTAEDILWRLMTDAEFGLNKDDVRYPGLTRERRDDIREVLGMQVWEEMGETIDEMCVRETKEKIRADATLAYYALPLNEREIIDKANAAERAVVLALKVTSATHKLTMDAIEKLRKFVDGATDQSQAFKVAHVAHLQRTLERDKPIVTTVQCGVRIMVFLPTDYEKI